MEIKDVLSQTGIISEEQLQLIENNAMLDPLGGLNVKRLVQEVRKLFVIVETQINFMEMCKADVKFLMEIVHRSHHITPLVPILVDYIYMGIEPDVRNFPREKGDMLQVMECFNALPSHRSNWKASDMMKVWTKKHELYQDSVSDHKEPGKQ